MEPGTVITTTSGVSFGDGIDLLMKVLGSIMAVVVVIHQGWTRLELERQRHNGGTEPVKTVAVLEEIATLTRDNGAKLESLKKISTDMEQGIEQLQLYNTTAERVSIARREGREEMREEMREEERKANRAGG